MGPIENLDFNNLVEAVTIFDEIKINKKKDGIQIKTKQQQKQMAKYQKYRSSIYIEGTRTSF